MKFTAVSSTLNESYYLKHILLYEYVLFVQLKDPSELCSEFCATNIN
ncbi:hypothetical protein JMJ99_08645 [Companilactobacillus zhachilii]|jgi:hypothetical protein|nr:hypothetical protein [Companilactobacillus zhachilii]MBL3531433.1 hypothetical protein [Companilactobacillus zhachilii]